MNTINFMKRPAMALLIVLLASLCSAQELTITSAKEVYGPGDLIILMTTVGNTGGEGEALIVEIHISGDGFTVPPMVTRAGGFLEASEHRQMNFTFSVIDTMPAGKYNVKSTLYEGENKVGEAQTSFTVAGTLKTIDLRLISCKDISCTDTSTLFYVGETAYLNYQSQVDDLTVKGMLTLPDGSVKEVTLPSTFEIQREGMYHLTVEASKEGYKTASSELTFGALEGKIEVLEGKIEENQEEPVTQCWPFGLIGMIICLIQILAAWSRILF